MNQEQNISKAAYNLIREKLEEELRLTQNERRLQEHAENTDKTTICRAMESALHATIIFVKTKASQ